MTSCQLNEILCKNWNVVISNHFGYFIKTQHLHEAIFDVEVEITIKATHD